MYWVFWENLWGSLSGDHISAPYAFWALMILFVLSLLCVHSFIRAKRP